MTGNAGPGGSDPYAGLTWSTPAAPEQQDTPAASQIPPGWDLPPAALVSPAQVAHARTVMLWLRLAAVLIVVVAVATFGYIKLTDNVVFSDNFKDSHSGWFTGSDQSNITMSYGTDGYSIAGPGSSSFDITALLSNAPYDKPLKSLSVAASAVVTANSEPEAGFGVACVHLSGSIRFSYEFTVTVGGKWNILARTGSQWSNRTAPPILRSGDSPLWAGTVPVTIKASCSTAADGSTTHLVFTVGDKQVADLTNTYFSKVFDGWTGAFEGVFTRTSSTATTSWFEERDLSR